MKNRVSVTLPPDVFDALLEIASQQGWTLSRAMRFCLRRGILNARVVKSKQRV